MRTAPTWIPGCRRWRPSRKSIRPPMSIHPFGHWSDLARKLAWGEVAAMSQDGGRHVSSRIGPLGGDQPGASPAPPAIDAALGRELPCAVREARLCPRGRFTPLVKKADTRAQAFDARDGPIARTHRCRQRAAIRRVTVAPDGVEIHIVADQTRLTQKDDRDDLAMYPRARGGGGIWRGSASCGLTWRCTSPACALKRSRASPASSADSPSTWKMPPS